MHGHKNIVWMAAVAASLVVLGAAGTAEAQFRRGRVIIAPRVVVGGAYYYDPFWYDPFYGGYDLQYPIGPYGGYPVYRGYRMDAGASVRLEVKPKEAEVYLDGYYAGIVDDFDGVFQRLEASPGDHDISLYLDGYRAVHQKVYLSPRNTFRIKYTMERLASGEQAEPRPEPLNPPNVQAGQPAPMPPPGRGTRRMTPPPPPEPPQPREPRDTPRDPRDNPRGTARTGAPNAGYGSVSIRVQPGDAEIMVDGEKWRGSGNGQDALVIELADGPHTIQISKSGYRSYITDVQVRRGETTPLNVSLRSQNEQ